MMKIVEQNRRTWSRRDSFKLAGVAGLVGMFGGALQAQTPKDAPATMIQGAGFYRHHIGDIEVILVSDGSFPMVPSSLFPQAGDAIAPAAKDAFVSTEGVTGHVNTLVVKSGGKTLLVDTGCGNLFGASTGRLKDNLARAGVDRIDTVLITHAHGDHVGGMLSSKDKPLFARPNYLITQTEYKFWHAEKPDLSKSLLPAEGQTQMIATSKNAVNRLAILDKDGFASPDQPIIPGVFIELAPGHTPGHAVVRIESGKDAMLYITDAVHLPALQLAHPDWHVAFDADPVQAAQTRKKLLDRCVADRVLVAGAHVPFPGFGHIDKVADRYAWVPIVWQW